MLEWDWSWMFALLPLPLLVRWWLTPVDNVVGAIRIPNFAVLKGLDASGQRARTRSSFAALLAALFWLSMVAAAARPTWVGDAIALPLEKRDLMLAVDISRSMGEEDMLIGQTYVNRITAVKRVVSNFIDERTGDRLGLILFGEQAYLQTPLTFDRNTLREQLNEAQLGFAGNATAIGDAIGLAVKRLRDRPAESRVLVLLTDGANTAGADPRSAAVVADEAGIRIHTIGIGATQVPQRDFFGRLRNVNPSAELDEETLRLIATRTGGEFFRAEDPNELAAVYNTLNEIEPLPEEELYRPRTSLLHWPLALALASLLLLIATRGVR